MSDYLWDKTGEPDGEVERLEELLGTLRHDSRQELELPIEVVTPKRARFSLLRSPFAALTAVAAALVLIALAMTMWRGVMMRHGGEESDAAQVAHKKSDEQSSGQSRSEPQLAPDDAGTRGPTEGGSANNSESSIEPGVSAPHLPAVTGRGALPFGPRNAAQRQRKRRLDVRSVHAAEMAEAERAKEQLMLALQVASAKFNLAQRKAPGISDVSPGGGNSSNNLVQQNRAR